MFKKLKKIVLTALLITILVTALLPAMPTMDVLAAPRTVYWVEVAGSGTGNWSDTAHWDETGSGGAGGDAVPDADDSVVFDGNSFLSGTGTVTVDVVASCLDMDWTGATNTPTLATSANLSIFGATTLIAAMTVTNNWNILFEGGNITSNGRTIAGAGTIYFGSGGVALNCTLQDAFSAAGCPVSFANGTLNTNGQTVTGTTFTISGAGAKTLTLGASTINCTAWNYSGSNLTVSANTATINVTGTGAVALGTANWNGADFNLNGTAHTVSGSPTGIAVFTRNGTATKTDTLTLTSGDTLTCTTFAMIGNSATNRLLVQSSTLGTAATVTATNWTGFQNVDCMDITATNAVDLSGGSAGDCGGNTGITFTTAAAQISNAAGNWSTLATWQDGVGTDRVPLPQDDVSCSHNVTVDMPRIGKSITFTGTPTVTLSNTVENYGSLTLVNGMTFTLNAKGNTFRGRGSYTLTTGGNALYFLTLNAPWGTLTLQDDLTDSVVILPNNGVLDFNDNAVVTGYIDCDGSATRSLLLGNGTFTLDYTTATSKWRLGTTTGLTFDAEGSTIVLTNSTANAQTFEGGGLTYNHVRVEGAGAYTLTMTGTNVIDELIVNAPTGTTLLNAVQDIGTLTHTSGTIDLNDLNHTIGVFDSNNANVRTVNMGTGTLTVDSAAVVTKWNLTDPTNLTFNHENCTIALSNAAATAQAFAGGGQTYNAVTIEGAGNYPLTLSGDNTFATFTVDRSAAAKTLTFTSGSTQTMTTPVCAVNDVVYVTINSTTPGTPSNLVMAGGGTFDGDFLNITDSAAHPNPAWYAVRSIDGGGVTGWVFHPLGLINHAWYQPNYMVLGTDLIDRSYYGLEFDGAGDEVDCGAAPVIDITDTATLTAWVYIDDDGENNGGSIIDRRDAAPDGYRLYVSSEAAGNVAIETILDGATDAYAVSDVVVSTGVWHYIVAVYNRLGTFHWEIYEDGVLLGLSTDQAGVLPITGHTANVMNIGDNAASDRCFDGMLDEPSFYTTAWTQALVTANYNVGSGLYTPTNTTGSALQLHMEEGSLAAVADTSGEANDGTITNAVWVNGYVPRPAGNSGTNDGIFTWGANPAGIDVSLGGMVSEGQPTPRSLPSDPARDILPETEVSDWFVEPAVGTTLLNNPLRPFVTYVE